MRSFRTYCNYDRGIVVEEVKKVQLRRSLGTIYDST